VFLLSIAGFALVVAHLASVLGLTDSLGAFIAGLVISSSRHRERAIKYSAPLQMLFSAIFFVSIGMLLDVRFFLERWDLVLVLAAGTVIVKVLTSSVAARSFGRSLSVAVSAAFLLAQVGEFSFVLELAGRAEGLSPAGVGADGSQAFIATAVVLFLLTPLLDRLGQRAGRRLGGTGRGDAIEAADLRVRGPTSGSRFGPGLGCTGPAPEDTTEVHHQRWHALVPTQRRRFTWQPSSRFPSPRRNRAKRRSIDSRATSPTSHSCSRTSAAMSRSNSPATSPLARASCAVVSSAPP
jgi:hypothetical protein